MKQTALMKRIVSTEFLFAAVLVAIFYVSVGEYDWWWLILAFPLFDLSAVGYIANNKAGAFTYNLGHSLIGPTVLVATFILTSSEPVLCVALLWLFHVFVDRALGYGMKHTKGFHHTHLGTIGKAKKK